MSLSYKQCAAAKTTLGWTKVPTQALASISKRTYKIRSNICFFFFFSSPEWFSYHSFEFALLDSLANNSLSIIFTVMARIRQVLKFILNDIKASAFTAQNPNYGNKVWYVLVNWVFFLKEKLSTTKKHRISIFWAVVLQIEKNNRLTEIIRIFVMLLDVSESIRELCVTDWQSNFLFTWSAFYVILKFEAYWHQFS